MSDYRTFFNEIKLALKELEIKRARGLHDYNVFSALMSESDEVRHSKILYSFLDPMGGHYQKDLFLKAFLKVCHLEKFGFNSADTKIVEKEVTTNGSKRMDLFLSDWFKHIILENKIYAGDNKNQISDYILGVVKDYQVKDAQDICVLYLTKEECLPSQNSLGDFKLDESNAKLFYKGNNENILKLENLEQGILFKNLCYEKEIKEWINKCLEEVANLHDLSVFFKQYDKLLDKLYHKEPNMNSELHKIMEVNYEIAKGVAENFNPFRAKKVVEFLAQAKEQIEQKMSADDRVKWEVFCENNINKLGKNCERGLRFISKEIDIFRIVLIMTHEGDFKFEKPNLEINTEGKKYDQDIFNKFLETDYQEIAQQFNINEKDGIANGGRHFKGKYYKYIDKSLNINEDFVGCIIDKTLSAEKLCEFILDYFNENKALVETLNAKIKKYAKK
ncbi:PD-(D/E)XK nuclease family protein [Helicobacter pylori]